jgi:hypothetical protein
VRPFTILFRRLEKCSFYALALIATLRPLPIIAQSFCGPLTLVNFNGINGQYPVSGVTFDTQAICTARLPRADRPLTR